MLVQIEKYTLEGVDDGFEIYEGTAEDKSHVRWYPRLSQACVRLLTLVASNTTAETLDELRATVVMATREIISNTEEDVYADE